MTNAWAHSPECVSVIWAVAPSPYRASRSAARPTIWSCGAWPRSRVTNSCFQPTPRAIPVPRAFAPASLAANRAARARRRIPTAKTVFNFVFSEDFFEEAFAPPGVGGANSGNFSQIRPDAADHAVSRTASADWGRGSASVPVSSVASMRFVFLPGRTIGR